MHINTVGIHINPQTSPCDAERTTLLLKYFISSPFSQSSTFVGDRYIHSIETRWRRGFQNTNQRGMFNQPRSLCVAMCCFEGGSGRKEGPSLICILFRCLVLVGSSRNRIFLWELKPRCHANRHTRPHHSKNIIYGSAVSITNASHSAITHCEQCKNSLQFELVGNNPVPPMNQNVSVLFCSHVNVKLYIISEKAKQNSAVSLILISPWPQLFLGVSLNVKNTE